MRKKIIPKIFKIAAANPLVASIIWHVACFISVYMILWQFGCITAYPTNKNLVSWDAVWYEKIREAGYHYSELTGGTMAFFPLFPFLWRLLGLNAIGVSILNFFIFLSGFCLLSKCLKWNFKQNLLFLSTPSLFFCFVPYSEALFFLGSALLLIGLHKDRIAIILLGLVITTLTRSVGIVFIPALIFTYIYIGTEKSYLHILLKVLTGITVIIAGSLIAFLVQYLYTGKWFVFFEIQKHWKRQFQIPTLPFTTITNFGMLWLDGVAFLFTLLAAFYILFLLLAYYKEPLNKIKVRPEALFSVAYIAVIGFISTFFSGVWSNDYGTSLMSINRFVFATLDNNNCWTQLSQHLDMAENYVSQMSSQLMSIYPTLNQGSANALAIGGLSGIGSSAFNSLKAQYGFDTSTDYNDVNSLAHSLMPYSETNDYMGIDHDGSRCQ